MTQFREDAAERYLLSNNARMKKKSVVIEGIIFILHLPELAPTNMILDCTDGCSPAWHFPDSLVPIAGSFLARIEK